jgi:hypothetical protein
MRKIESPRIGFYGWTYLIALICGTVLRLIYPRDAVWDPDQVWNFEHGIGVGSTLPWGWLGMMSSGGVRNPGMSLWIFVLLVRTFGITNPEQLSRTIAVISILAIVLIGFWALIQLRGSDQEVWLAAGAIAAVNPVAIFLDRVIWAQSTLPLLAVAFWIGIWNRERWWGALLWGGIGVCLSQIHMAGFFVCAAAFLWVLLFKRQGPRWWAYVIGTVVAGWPLVFWLKYLASGHFARPSWPIWAHFPGKVWIWWLASDGGLGDEYLAANFWRLRFGVFLREPRILGLTNVRGADCLYGLGAPIVECPVGIVPVPGSATKRVEAATAYRRHPDGFPDPYGGRRVRRPDNTAPHARIRPLFSGSVSHGVCLDRFAVCAGAVMDSRAAVRVPARRCCVAISNSDHNSDIPAPRVFCSSRIVWIACATARLALLMPPMHACGSTES